MTRTGFDESVAGSYDADVASMFEPSTLNPAVDLLTTLADGEPALEFAIGTGRLALPLADRGVPVSGIDDSEHMVAQLRAKAGGSADRIPVVIGDMATTAVPGAGSFALVYLAFNTITNLPTQRAQALCFENAARHLRAGGHFVVETFVPALRRLPPGETFVPFDVRHDHVGVDEYDVVSQQIWSHHTYGSDRARRRTDGPFRYVWASELDLMADQAGFASPERWHDWRRTPFTADSESHVSVWRKSD